MDRNGKKPNAAHGDPPHPERSDTKAHIRDETERTDAEARTAAEKDEADARLALASAGRKGAQQLSRRRRGERGATAVRTVRPRAATSSAVSASQIVVV